MEHVEDTDSDRHVPDEQRWTGVYLPGMPRLSTTPGRFERFVKNLFRRRGGLRVVRRN